VCVLAEKGSIYHVPMGICSKASASRVFGGNKQHKQAARRATAVTILVLFKNIVGNTQLYTKVALSLIYAVVYRRCGTVPITAASRSRLMR
jgi:hypothetical protein